MLEKAIDKKNTSNFFDLRLALQKHFPSYFLKLNVQQGWRLKLLCIIVKEKRIIKLLQESVAHTERDTIDLLFRKAMQPIITSNNFHLLTPLKNKRLLFVANHPLGGLDGLALLHKLLPIFPDTKILANPLLQELKPLKNLFLAAEVFRKSHTEQTRAIKKHFSSIKNIIVFPAGHVARKINGTVTDSAWNHRLIKEAALCGRTLVLVNITAENSFWFYTLANLRKFFKIPLNLEMLLLPRETVCRKNVPINIAIKKIFTNSQLKNYAKLNNWQQTAMMLQNDIY